MVVLGGLELLLFRLINAVELCPRNWFSRFPGRLLVWINKGPGHRTVCVRRYYEAAICLIVNHNIYRLTHLGSARPEAQPQRTRDWADWTAPGLS